MLEYCWECKKPVFTSGTARWGYCAHHLLEKTLEAMKFLTNSSDFPLWTRNLEELKRYFKDHPEETLEC